MEVKNLSAPGVAGLTDLMIKFNKLSKDNSQISHGSVKNMALIDHKLSMFRAQIEHYNIYQLFYAIASWYLEASPLGSAPQALERSEWDRG